MIGTKTDKQPSRPQKGCDASSSRDAVAPTDIAPACCIHWTGYLKSQARRGSVLDTSTRTNTSARSSSGNQSTST